VLDRLEDLPVGLDEFIDSFIEQPVRHGLHRDACALNRGQRMAGGLEILL
jgi:hypothetical protein